MSSQPVTPNDYWKQIRKKVGELKRLGLGEWFVTGAVTATLATGMWQLGAWKPLEYLGYNALFQARNATLPYPKWNDQVAVIAIDDASLKQYGKFPWSRDRYAQLLQVLSTSPPAVIGFDLLFADADSQDTKLAMEMEKARNVVLGTAWDVQGKPIESVSKLQEVAVGEGHIYHQLDTDGISRKATVLIGGKPMLGLMMLYVADQKGFVKATEALKIIPETVEVSDRLDVLINWSSKTQDIPPYSFADVISGKVPAETFKGKLVLVGNTSTAADPLRSPFNQNPPTSGVYLHAALIDNLLNQRLLQPLPHWGVLVLLLSIASATSWLLSKQQLRGRIITIIGLPTLWLAIALTAFTQNKLVPIVAPIGTILIAGVGVQLREQYEKQQLMSLFAKHVSPETAKHIWQRKEEILEKGKIPGQELVATVLFADIRGFTSISETLPPYELLTWLNQYFEAMTGCIMDRGGVIDKYIGDAIMAVFGIPFPHTEPDAIRQDAQNCIEAAIAMQDRLVLLNQKLATQGLPTIEIGIGIHTGSLVAGSVGGTQRLNYSVLGDTVNVAARLEPMNKEIKTNNPYNIITTRKTFAYICDRYDASPIGAIQLRGRKEETMVYSILGEREAVVASNAIVPSKADFKMQNARN